jgi:uncharacterized protein (DUF2236 family)
MSGPLFPASEEVDQLTTGPDSITWRYGSDARLYLAMLYPLLLQVAHPTVGAGVHDYSDFERRPFNRLFRTIDYLLVLQYGGRDAAAMGHRLRDLHKRFKGFKPNGERYHALEPGAYAWVHATLLEAYVAGHAHFGRPMKPDQIERFYKEYLGLGRLIGVRNGDLPPDWRGFRRYFDDVVQNELERTDSVDRVLRAIHTVRVPGVPDSASRALRMPAGRLLYLGGVGLLPAVLRARCEIRWTRRDQRQFELIGAASRRLTPLMPKSLLIVGPAQLRFRRRAIARGPLGAGEQVPAPLRTAA